MLHGGKVAGRQASTDQEQSDEQSALGQESAVMAPITIGDVFREYDQDATTCDIRNQGDGQRNQPDT